MQRIPLIQKSQSCHTKRMPYNPAYQGQQMYVHEEQMYPGGDGIMH